MGAAVIWVKRLFRWESHWAVKTVWSNSVVLGEMGAVPGITVKYFYADRQNRGHVFAIALRS